MHPRKNPCCKTAKLNLYLTTVVQIFQELATGLTGDSSPLFDPRSYLSNSTLLQWHHSFLFARPCLRADGTSELPSTQEYSVDWQVCSERAHWRDPHPRCTWRIHHRQTAGLCKRPLCHSTFYDKTVPVQLLWLWWLHAGEMSQSRVCSLMLILLFWRGNELLINFLE